MSKEQIAQPSPTIQVEAYSPESYAAAFNIGRTKVFEEIKTGRLKARKLGTRTIILRDDGLEYMRSLPLVREPEAA